MLPPTVSEQAGHDPLTPEQAVDRLEELHTAAVVALRAALERFLASGAPPDGKERLQFRYPELRLTYDPSGRPPASSRRAWAKFQSPGTYATTVTQPGHFRAYLLEQLRPLVGRLRRRHRGGPRASRKSPTPTCSSPATTSPRRTPPPARARHGISRRPCSPIVGRRGGRRPLASRARPSRARSRCSMRCGSTTRCAASCTTPGTDWRHVQPWILLTNYHRYVDQFVRWGLARAGVGGRPLRAAGAAGRRRDRARR